MHYGAFTKEEKGINEGDLYMTDEEIQTNCKQIYHFIHYELSEWIDSNIFNQNTFEELGKLYYQHILNQLDFACNDLINRVVEVDAVEHTLLINKRTIMLHYVKFSI